MIRLRGWYAPLLTLAASLIACRNRDSGAPTQAKPQSSLRVVSFRNDVYPVLAKNCASAEGCHGNKPTPSVNLDLRASSAYGELVNKPSEGRRSAVRVKPGDPEASFLVDKLTGRLGPVQEGKQMPIDVDTGAPVVPSPLPPDFVDQVLERWIAAGAPNN